MRPQQEPTWEMLSSDQVDIGWTKKQNGATLPSPPILHALALFPVGT